MFDWLFGTEEALAEGRELDAKRAALVDPQYRPGGVVYERIKATQGEDAADLTQRLQQTNAGTGSADALDRKGNQIWDANNESDSGIGDLIKRIFVIGLVGAGLWVAVKFGGIDVAKRNIPKSRIGLFAVGCVAIALVWFTWRYIKGTADSAKNVGANFTKNLKTIF